MITASQKHLSVLNGRARFALVTVGRIEPTDIQDIPPASEILLSGYVIKDQTILEAAQRGIKKVEIDRNWQGPQHFVVKIEGLDVDGIDPNSAYIAAGKATELLLER